MSKPASRRARILCSSRALVCTNSSMSGWSTSSTTIFAARRVAPPDLMVPAEASAPRMKETGPDAVPPLDSSSFDDRMRERLRPAPEPPLKMKPSSLYQLRIESIESSTDRMKHAETCCGDGRRCEVAVVDAGLGVGLHDPVDELLEAPLPRLGADRAAEVLRGDDRARVHRPEVRELHPTLLEDGLAGLPVLLDDVAALPGDLVVGVGAGRAEDTLDRQAGLVMACAPRPQRRGLRRLRRIGHLLSSVPDCSCCCLRVLLPMVSATTDMPRSEARWCTRCAASPLRTGWSVGHPVGTRYGCSSGCSSPAASCSMRSRAISSSKSSAELNAL